MSRYLIRRFFDNLHSTTLKSRNLNQLKFVENWFFILNLNGGSGRFYTDINLERISIVKESQSSVDREGNYTKPQLIPSSSRRILLIEKRLFVFGIDQFILIWKEHPISYIFYKLHCPKRLQGIVIRVIDVKRLKITHPAYLWTKLYQHIASTW